MAGRTGARGHGGKEPTWPGGGGSARKLGKVSELVYLAFGPSPVDYLGGWDIQRRIHARRVADEVSDSSLLLEH
jgi:hypothetical protein